MMYLSITSLLKDVINGFKSLLSFIESIFTFFSNMLQELIYLIKYITQALVITGSFILTLPPWLSVFASVTVAISVLYIVLNRKGGAD